LFIFLIALNEGQYFVSLSIFETIFQTLSIGADISRLTLISSVEEAAAWGICPDVIITTEVIAMTTDIAGSVFLFTGFFKFVVLFIVDKKG
jgi:hypothetical protein